MNLVKGTLFRLKARRSEELDITRTPLGQPVDRTKILGKTLMRRTSAAPQRRGSVSIAKGTHHDPGHAPESHENQEYELFGHLILDWSERGFELCPTTCELRYHSSKVEPGEKESKFAPSMIAVGFVQQHTKASAGPYIESVDRNLQTGEKLQLHTLEIEFYPEYAIHPTYCILGHPDESERDRWLKAVEVLITKKAELHDGWHRFCNEHSRKSATKAEEWLRQREGDAIVQLNAAARRRARLMNGKVLQDVPKVFDKYSEECPDWPVKLLDDAEAGLWTEKRVMDASHIVEALAELGLELAPKIAKRVLEDVRRNPPCPDIPTKVDLRRFELIFRSCCVEFLVSPSDEMKENLTRIMQDSKNPFLSLLSPAEQKYLIEGKDADGRYFCTCKSYTKDAVLVQQGDEGDSMFIIIEGSLSVVVTFGAGSATVQKEVAVLPAGSVMGEMSLVLGKPRSATCVVKSESASVAEISKTAMVLLLDGRPSLARELEDMVYRRDTANYLSAGNNAAAMAAYRERGAGKAAAAAAGGAGGGAGGGGPGGRGGAGGSRPASRIQSRQSKAPPRRAQTSHGALPPVAGAGGGGGGGLPYRTAGDAAADGGPRVKTGRWVKCRGIYVFVVD